MVKKVWFNATQLGFPGNEQLLSKQDGTKLGELLLEANISWISELKTGTIEHIDKNLRLEVIYGGDIFPYAAEGQLLGNEKCDWETSFMVVFPRRVQKGSLKNISLARLYRNSLTKPSRKDILPRPWVTNESLRRRRIEFGY